MREIFVGRTEAPCGWIRVLDQERIGHREVVTAAPVVVWQGRLPDWAGDFVEAGGVFAVSGAAVNDPLLPSGFTALVTGFSAPGRKTRSQAPCLVTMFECEGDGELRLHENRVVKYNVDPDLYPAVITVRRGRGAIVASGIPLTDLLDAPGDRLRTFCDFSQVTERVASVDKAVIADTLVGMLRSAFELAGLPLVTVARFPNGAPSVLIVRVDVDGVFGDRLRLLATAAASHDVPASIFLNGDYSRLHDGDLSGWSDRMEVGQHAWLHTLMPTRDDNRTNLERAARWMQDDLGVSPRSFVAPRGLWNRSLGEALADLGYRYSSDFGLDFDSLPFRSDGGVLQVPVHPYSPERAKVWAAENGAASPTADDVSKHYLTAIREQVRNGRPAHIYGHPEVLGTMADQVLTAVCGISDELGLPRLTLGSYADFWIGRERLTPQVHFDAATGRVHVDTSDVDIPLCLHTATPTDVTVNGTDRGRLSSGLILAA